MGELTNRNPSASQDIPVLPEIPVVLDVDPPDLFRRFRGSGEALLAAGRAHYGGSTLAVADRLSRRWAEQTGLAYRDEIAAIARDLGTPGAWMLNLSFEWGCTTAVVPTLEGVGARLLRTLDWPLKGLGSELVVARQQGAAGPWFNVTWPGFVGVTTALAPGRFAGALNQAPMRTHGWGRLGDWTWNRWQVWCSRHTTPAILLRRAFDECATFEAAVELLSTTPLCIPVIYTLSGPGPNQGVVIERVEKDAHRHPAPVCVSNHWLTPGLIGRPRSVHSVERLEMMRGRLSAAADGFAWLEAPILNETTRLAVTANAATGELTVQGWEDGRPATSVLRLVA